MKDTATKAFYAIVGSPVLAYEKTMAMGGRLAEMAREDFDSAAKEGERVANKVRSTTDDISARVDLDQFQDRVDKLRDQLEDALAQWRDNFRPGEVKDVKKPAAQKAPAAAPAAKKPAAKTTAAKKPAAKTTARKSTAKKAPAKKAAASTDKPATS